MKVPPEFLQALDVEIAAKVAELDEARRAAERIGTLTNDLFSLKRTRQLLAGDDSQSIQDLIAEVNTSPASRVANGVTNGAHSTILTMPVSIGAAIVDALTKAGQPLGLGELQERVRLAIGKPDLTMQTLSAVISQYKRKRKLVQVGLGKYDLPNRQEVNAARK
jgi:hypothetical protein